MDELVLHVGLMKSGTTSVQRAMYAARSSLLEHGVEYIDVGQYNHMLHFVELLEADPHAVSRFPQGLKQHHREIRSVTCGLWPRLATLAVASQSRRLVLSAENLVYAGPRSVARLREVFADRAIRVIITHRPASMLVPSNYQQQSRIGPTGDFEGWCRRELTDMCEPTPSGSLSSLRLGHLLGVWEPEVDSVTLVETSSAGSLPRMWAAITGLSEATTPSTDGSFNVSMSAEFTAALQAFISDHPGLAVSELREVGHSAYQRHLRRVGGPHLRWQLESGLRRSLDAACAPDSKEADLLEVRKYLQSSAPLGRVKAITDSQLGLAELQELAARQIVVAHRRLRPLRAYRALRRRIR